MRVEDIEWIADEGASVLLRKSKTDQHGSEKLIHLTPETAANLQAWISEAQIEKGYIFRGIRPPGILQKAYAKAEYRVSTKPRQGGPD